jgi:hypothetical protein
VAGATTSAYFYIQAWTGNYRTLAAALGSGDSAVDVYTTGAIFNSPVAVAPTPAPGLSGAPAIVLVGWGVIPEPGTIALAGLGTAAWLIFRRRK